MNTSLLFSFLFLFTPVFSFSQTKFFIGTNGDYSILIDEDVKTKSTSDETQPYVDYYILTENNEFKFLLSIRKAGQATDPNFLFGEGFRNSYMSECDCELLDYGKQSFNNFDSMVMEIKANLDGKKVRGYSVGVVTSGQLFNINFFALESNFNSLKPRFDRILNHLIFR